MNNLFKDATYTRQEEFEGKSDWIWPLQDTGSWDGPTQDWIHNHKIKYFKNVKQKRTVITAGANCGLYAKQYASMFDRVYAFEPYPLSFYCLVNNVQEPNVIKMQAALGDISSFGEVCSSNLTNLGMNRMEKSEHAIYPIVTIDQFNFIDVDLIQLDVESYEYNVLLGARNTIEKYKPIVILENGTHQNIVNFMNALNYENSDQSVSDTIYVPKTYK